MSDQEYQDRLRKAEELRAMGINPYPSRFESTHSIEEVIKLGEKKTRTVEEMLAGKLKKQVTIRGRLMTFREHGRLAFANLKDFTGTVQICFMEQVLGKEPYKLLRKLDMGDFLGASGELFYTRHGQLTLLVSEWTFLGKALRPLPEKWHGIQDQEQIYRQRYLDLIMNEDAMRRFKLRSRCLGLIRRFLDEHQFTELEFPLLEVKASGATARPFTTHHNALDADVFLRIACELPQKMAIAGGFERTYEIARVFRNEGIDPSHLQEFTMLEWYAAYWNYEDNMNFTEQLVQYLIQNLLGTLKIQVRSREGDLVDVDFSPPWPRIDFASLIEKDCGIKIFDHAHGAYPDGDANALRKAIKKKGIKFEDMDEMGYGNLCDYLYKKVSRPHLIQPCFVINHPAGMKPLARRSDRHPEYCETLQLLVNTWEVVNAYSEIVDPQDQEARFIDQAAAQRGGDENAMELDVRFITAMEHGMPPISGNGMGLDRFMTLILGESNLKDLVLFPLMRPTDEELKAEKKMREKAKQKLKKAKKSA
ncbi:MAG: lysine--tRNA ligase [Candidatus Gracilibacteria bacterium]